MNDIRKRILIAGIVLKIEKQGLTLKEILDSYANLTTNEKAEILAELGG